MKLQLDNPTCWTAFCFACKHCRLEVTHRPRLLGILNLRKLSVRLLGVAREYGGGLHDRRRHDFGGMQQCGDCAGFELIKMITEFTHKELA